VLPAAAENSLLAAVRFSLGARPSTLDSFAIPASIFSITPLSEVDRSSQPLKPAAIPATARDNATDVGAKRFMGANITGVLLDRYDFANRLILPGLAKSVNSMRPTQHPVTAIRTHPAA